MAKDLTKLFNQFAGKEVPMTETTRSYGPGIRGIYREINLADPKDPVIEEMKKVAKANGLQLRLLWPSMAGTMDFNPHRITAYIGKEADGKYRVSSDFSIG
jgi:hypothetical protein